MAERGKVDPRTISHGLPDELETTIGDRLAAQREGDRTHPSPQAPKQIEPIGNTDEAVAPDEGEAPSPF